MEKATLGIEYYREELEKAIMSLHGAQEEIKALESEIDDQNAIIKTLREELDKISHDEIVITTKHKVSAINVYFERGGR